MIYIVVFSYVLCQASEHEATIEKRLDRTRVNVETLVGICENLKQRNENVEKQLSRLRRSSRTRVNKEQKQTDTQSQSRKEWMKDVLALREWVSNEQKKDRESIVPLGEAMFKMKSM